MQMSRLFQALTLEADRVFKRTVKEDHDFNEFQQQREKVRRHRKRRARLCELHWFYVLPIHWNQGVFSRQAVFAIATTVEQELDRKLPSGRWKMWANHRIAVYLTFARQCKGKVKVHLFGVQLGNTLSCL